MNSQRSATTSGAVLQQRGETLFHAALQIPAAQRAAFLGQHCGGDADLRRHVELLLSAHELATGFLESPLALPAEKTLLTTAPVTESAGDRIGRYKLLQPLGEGGCGVVYMAEQEEPVRRRVALKVIKLGMDTRSVIARFEAERQALAMMDHPNIARVLDAGATETGRPFFVMELVRGIRITEYCDQNKLTTEERLKLFIQVCHAIQHAHQKGIIHRDIKPSNILVTLHDGVPVPKVIDFGIAKATQGRLTDQTLFTAFEQFIGTPAYMSPEQAEMSGLDIDTRCDIYALGVLLYELLTGKTPFDAKELLASGLDQMRKTIRERDPERPSTLLSTMVSAELTSMAQHRRSDAPRLVSLMRGDLDWIVMKALEKDRTRRYETANGLALDVERYLNNEAVLARPPSSVYRFQKLIRRNKSVFAGVSAAFGALTIGFFVCLYLLVREREARRRAVAAEQEQTRLRQQAEDNARVGQQLTSAGLMLSRGQYEDAERAVANVRHPSVSAILNALGIVRSRMGEYPAAIANFNRVIEVIPDNLEGYHSLAPLLLFTGRVDDYRALREKIIEHFATSTDPIVAERMARDCLLLPLPASQLPTVTKMADVAYAAGPVHRYWAYFEYAKGLAEYRQGRFVGAAELMEKVIATPSDPHRTAAATLVLALAQHALGNEAAARQNYQKGKAMLAKSDPLHGTQWDDAMASRVIAREAEAVFEPSATHE